MEKKHSHGHKHKKQVCMLCGKPSQRSICETCAARVQGEALHKKKKEEKIKE